MRGKRPSALAAAGLILALLGCGGKPGVDQKPTHPVRGRVLLEGRPVSGATVVFFPADGDVNTVKSYARTDGNGYFTLSTYQHNDGAPEGKYRVTVSLYDDGEGVHRLPARYASPGKTDLRANVEVGDNDLRPFHLRADAGL